MARLTILPDSSEEAQTLDAPETQSLLDTLSKAGIALVSPCGGEGTCGKCRVHAHGELSPPSMSERTLLGDLLGDGLRLSCQTLPLGAVELSIPQTSRVPAIRVLAGGTGRQVAFFPNVRRRTFHWERPDLEITNSEFNLVTQFLNARADLKADLPTLRKLAEALEHGKTFTATILGDRLIEIVPGQESAPPLGVAVDIGTTTVVAQVVNLETGESVGTASALNDQTQYGGDVISRINMALGDPDGLRLLAESGRATVLRCIQSALEKRSPEPVEGTHHELSNVYEITVVGNTTMLHLFAGVSPHSLGTIPFAPVFHAGLDVPAQELDLPLSAGRNVYLLPSIAGYMGADTVGAMLATSFDEPYDGVRLVADIGTNCELVLQRGSELIGCSTPAGPAFEGARIEFGMMAGPGAIERVRMDDDCHVRVIGGESPRGICGSGVVDAVAEALRVGVIDETGRIQDEDDLTGILAPFLLGRIRPLQFQSSSSLLNLNKKNATSPSIDANVVASSPTLGELHRKGNAIELARTAEGEPIYLTQKDVREIQLAKAAIRSGIDTLLDIAGLRPEDIDELLIAGGFGNYLNGANARRMGMIPNVPDEKIRFVGNAALVGARLALISTDMRNRAERVARSVRHVQIAATPGFRDRFAEAMLFL